MTGACKLSNRVMYEEIKKMSNNIDQYAKVKLGGGNEFMAKGPLEFMSEVDFGDATSGVFLPERYFFFPLRSVSGDITLHDTAPHQHKTMQTAACGGLHRFRKDTNNLKARTPNYRQPSYRPCTWHCLEKRRRRFEAPSTRLYRFRKDTSNLYRHNIP